MLTIKSILLDKISKKNKIENQCYISMYHYSNLDIRLTKCSTAFCSSSPSAEIVTIVP